MKTKKTILNDENFKKLKELNNSYVIELVEKYATLCRPKKVTVLTDSKEDIDWIRQLAINSGEEQKLKTEGHTMHFDSYYDQARDKKNTRVLLPKGIKTSKFLEWRDRKEGLNEIFDILDGIMEGKEMFVCFFCLGPTNSRFSIPALQLTDSAYVVHSETILYRAGYEEFKRLKGTKDFFYFVHSAGELDERKNTKNIDKRRVYIDLQENRVFTVNNQYAGNSVGLKKLALRLAINKANQEDWLCEHMLIIGVHQIGKYSNKDRVTYLTGAYPSTCGKTSTAMISGQTIVGDDIAYIKIGDDGLAYAVNVEQGIFGIIQDINPKDDPITYKALTTPRELIFSNVLVKDGIPYWSGMGKELPTQGINFSGEWHKGKIDKDGKLIDASNKNARYTLRINELDNVDAKTDDPNGVKISGFIYGGRDSDTTVPVFQSLSWSHGVYIGAIVESETTAATIGKAGIRESNPMANLDFLVIPLGLYIKNHLAFGDRLDEPPVIFHTNYFLKENGKYLNSMHDKKVWLMWMEGRVHNEFGAIETAIGFIPKYEDLKKLFKDFLNKDYTKEEYEKQFTIRTKKLLEKIERMEKIYKEEKETEEIPEVFFAHLKQERKRLEKVKEKYGKENISPFKFD